MSTTETHHLDRRNTLVRRKVRDSQHLIQDNQRMQTLKWRLRPHSQYQRILAILVRSPGDAFTKAQVYQPLYG